MINIKDLPRKPGIYVWINKINHKQCFGQTNNFYLRVKRYKGEAPTRPIIYALNKYGWDKFDFKILHEFDYDDEQERLWIESNYIECYQTYLPENGYNILKYGNNRGGIKLSMKIKKRMSEDRMGIKNHFYGKHHTQATKDAISKQKIGKYCGVNSPCFGIKHTPERIERQRLKILGTKQTPQQVAAKSALWKLKYKNGYINPNTGRVISLEEKAAYSHKVKQINRETGEVIKIWNSIIEATKGMGLKSPFSIRSVCIKQNKTAGGFYWEYA